MVCPLNGDGCCGVSNRLSLIHIQMCIRDRGFPNGCVYRLTFNNQRPPFDDPDIHWAINHAIDRTQYIQLAYEGST